VKLLETAISTGKNLAFQSAYFCLQNALKFTYARLERQKFFRGSYPRTPVKGEGKEQGGERTGKGREGKGKGGKERGEGREKGGKEEGKGETKGTGLGEGLRHCSSGGWTPLGYFIYFGSK
jgi:hypothetical protein